MHCLHLVSCTHCSQFELLPKDPLYLSPFVSDSVLQMLKGLPEDLGAATYKLREDQYNT